MDPVQTVGGACGLKKIADALRAEHFVVEAVKLIRLVADNEHVDWVIPLATRTKSREVIFKTFEPRRDGKAPMFGHQIRIDAVPTERPEAARATAHAQRFSSAPSEFGGVLLHSMRVDCALLAHFPRADAAAA